MSTTSTMNIALPEPMRAYVRELMVRQPQDLGDAEV
jgi:hypothetical protein